MNVDPDNPVVALCAAGMAVEGDPSEALALFKRAWAERRDDYEACIAAHFVARHQKTLDATLYWNEVAVRHAEAVVDDRAVAFMASLYLNVADTQSKLGCHAAAGNAIATARRHLDRVPAGGYRDFVEFGICRLERELRV